MHTILPSTTHLATLAKIQLSEAKQQSIQKELVAILNMVDELNTVSTEHISPTGHITGLQNITRKDQENYTFAKEDMVKTMPETDADGYLQVHAVFGDNSPSH
ncbi:MAG TPA: Asp-tRNA(Asn)/Glu-tRNA(Gln) amidotransferase subunit GatC [Patescibacteria group bacterium]|nr:Asp-tRNA(Asn)/Glu-tRNA(Gln) amidotransferase subunit GatC [Patescibacteria group bacterium]